MRQALSPERREQKRSAQKRWRDSRKVEKAAYDRAWALNNPEAYMLNNMRGAARARGHECSITLDELKELLAPMRCSMTGIQLSWEGPVKANPIAPSPDRIDHNKGYVSGNVRIVSWIYNRARGNNSDEDVIAMAKALLSFISK